MPSSYCCCGRSEIPACLLILESPDEEVSSTRTTTVYYLTRVSFGDKQSRMNKVAAPPMAIAHYLGAIYYEYVYYRECRNIAACKDHLPYQSIPLL
jgi:hypothetical protein